MRLWGRPYLGQHCTYLVSLPDNGKNLFVSAAEYGILWWEYDTTGRGHIL